MTRKALILLLICCAVRALASAPPDETRSATASFSLLASEAGAASSSGDVPEPTPTTGVDSDGSTGLLPSSSSEQSFLSASPGPTPTTPSVPEELTPSAPLSPSSSTPPSPTPAVEREVVVVRAQVMVVGEAPSESDMDALQLALSTAVEMRLSSLVENVTLLSFTACESAPCFQLDFAVATTKVHNIDLLNGTGVTGQMLNTLLPNSTVLISDVQVLRNTNPACVDFTGINYNCRSVDLPCPAGLACVPASQASLQVPCGCNAVGGLSNCSGVIASVCSSATTTPDPPLALPSWVVTVVVCVGAALLACVCLACIICCVCCCYKICGTSKRTIYLTQGHKGAAQSPTPYVDSLYKDNPNMTFRNVSDVDGNGFNLAEQEGEGQGEERDRTWTTSETFKLGWVKDPEIQDPERQDPEIQESEIQDPERQNLERQESEGAHDI